MIKQYWAFFYATLIATILLIILFILGHVFAKKLFLSKKYGVAKLILYSCLFLFMIPLFASHFIRCCEDYKYVSTGTYMEEKAKVVEFTYSKIDYDGNGRLENRKPKFYLIEKDEYIVLHAKPNSVEVGETYIVRFYPNTKICDVIEKLEDS